jgi:hypothetical protein
MMKDLEFDSKRGRIFQAILRPSYPDVDWRALPPSLGVKWLSFLFPMESANTIFISGLEIPNQ